MPSVPIRYAVPGLLALVIAVAVGLTTWLSYQSGQLAANEQATHLSQEVAGRIQDRVLSFVETPQQFHEINLGAIRSGAVNVQDFESLRRYFWQQVHISKSAPYLYYANEQGSFIGINTDYDNGETVYKIEDKTTFPNRLAYRVDQKGDPVGQPVQRDQYDARTRPWYQVAAKAGKPVWSPIYTFAAKRNLGISVSAPVFDRQGRLEGVLGIDLTLEQLTNFLRNLKPSPNGRSFIAEKNGLLVATSAQEEPYRTTTKTGPGGQAVVEQNRLKVTESDDPLIRAAARYLERTSGGLDRIPFATDPNTGQPQPYPFVFDLNGQAELGQVVSVTGEGGLSWLVVVVIPSNDFMARVYENIRRTVFFGVLVLLGAALLGFLLARRIIGPIARVIAVAALIEKGRYELDRLAPVEQRTDEMGQLARVFRRMASEVHAREQQLQRKVARLQVEIDEVKRRQQVAEIIETDQFKSLQEKAQRLRAERNRLQSTPEKPIRA